MKPTEHLTITERPGTYITVMSDSSGPIIVVRDGLAVATSRYTPEEAAKLGLAVLEAAGYGEEVVTDGSPDGHIQVAKYYLYEGVKAHASITAEARERAELEAEAVELFNANHGTNRTDWDRADRSVISSWVRVARRARELAKEATK